MTASHIFRFKNQNYNSRDAKIGFDSYNHMHFTYKYPRLCLCEVAKQLMLSFACDKWREYIETVFVTCCTSIGRFFNGPEPR